MKLRSTLLFLLAFFGMSFSASAANFTSDIEQGFIKKNAIQTQHFQFEFSDLVAEQSDSDRDGIADIIEVIADTAEHSYEVFIEDMDYPFPSYVQDGRIIVILDDNDSYLSSGALGITSILSNGDPYVAIDPFLSNELLRVTMAHEFYHVIQFGMGIDFAYYDQGINLAESTATWSEEFTYDEINDYQNYLPDFFEYPDYSIFASYVPSGTLYEYALSIWPLFLSEQYGEDLILNIWEDYQDLTDYSDPLALYEVVSNLLDAEGSSLNEAYLEFALWNLDLDFYSEGEDYPSIQLLTSLTEGELTLVEETYAPALYGSNYLYFENNGGEDGFYFQIVKPDGVEFAVTLVPLDGNDFLGEDKEQVVLGAYEDMSEALSLPSGDYDGVVAIVSALGADFEEVSDPELVFDEGFFYYYLAQYGSQPDLNPEEVEVDETGEKDGEEVSQHDDVRLNDTLKLDLNTYDEDSVTLSWNRPSSDAALYDIWYWNDDEEFVKTIDQGYITSTNITGLEEGTSYTFQVFAYDENEDAVTDGSNEIRVTLEEWLFSDLSFLDPHYDSISSLVEMGIFEGYPNGSFQPEGVINRAELLKILIEGQGIEVDENLYKNCFPDVNREWFAKYVCYAKAQGIIDGYPDGTYKPGNTINKVEALKILFNAYEAGLIEGRAVNDLAYPDLDGRAWYAIYVDEASDLGLLEEVPGEAFDPSGGRSRGDMAEILYRYLIHLDLIEN